MTRCAVSELPPYLSEKDKALILAANDQKWEYIDETKAESLEAREILHDIALSKYHRDEYASGME